jgi:hypothetical protein
MFIPKKIRVGFQNRSDTYTNNLAYVIYYDEKGVVRKEKSWNSWRDPKIDPVDFDNTPTSGFVLNKKVGGYKSDWNFRNAYVRVYDPRNFEFEITIPNLLFILENSSSIKGKGLEGEFVYGWNGPELYLIPVDCPKYTELQKINDLRHSKEHIKAKELILGATYRHKSNNALIYLGRFDLYETGYNKFKGTNKGLHYYFRSQNSSYTQVFKSLGGALVELIDGNCVDNYAEMIEVLEKSSMYSPVVSSKDEYIEYTLEELRSSICSGGGWIYMHVSMLGYTASCDYNQGSIRSIGKNPPGFGVYFSGGYIDGKYQNYKEQEFSSLEELHDKLKPCYKNEYLANGRLHSCSKK